jgi:hypothetical protein
MKDSTAVDGDIIQEVAQKYNMGAGGLKGLLESSNLDEYEEDSREVSAVTEAYRKQHQRNTQN